MFELGQLVATPGALEALERNRQTPMEFIERHVNHDWGELDEHDKKENDYSVIQACEFFRHTSSKIKPASG
jgi:hypothetical protein